MDEIEKLISTAHGDDLNERLQAVANLGRIRQPRALEALIGLLQDGNNEVSAAAARALGEIGDARAVGPLCSILSDYFNGRAAADALGMLGAPAVEQVITVLEEKPDLYRRPQIAAEVLSQIGDDRAIGPLIAALQRSCTVAFVRNTVPAALVSLGEPAIAQLHAALRDGNLGCADFLSRIGSLPARQALVDALQDEKEDVRREAAISLANIEDTRAVAALIGLLPSSNAWTRLVAVRSLGKFSDARILEPLISVLADEDADVQKAAVSTLSSAQIIPESAFTSLVSLLHHPKFEICNAATSALCKTGAFGVETMINLLKDRDKEIRTRAVNALGMLGDARALEPLRMLALEDEDLWVRKSAEKALKRLGEAHPG